MVEEGGRRCRAKSDAEQDIASGWIPTALSGSPDDRANLLVAGPKKTELGRDYPDAPVGFSDGRRQVVEALGSRDEPRVDPGGESEHAFTVPVRDARKTRELERK